MFARFNGTAKVIIDIDGLRDEMIAAFHLWVNAKGLALRMKSWDFYVERREEFLKADCYQHSRRYVPLKDTIAIIGEN